MIRVGIIGAGVIGTIHAHAYGRIEGVEVVGIADIRAEAAERLARAVGAPVMETGDLLLSDAVDVVDICLPTHLHKEYVLRAASAGKHVFCEKPIARTLEDAGEMVRACEGAGVKFGVGHVLRFFPEYLKAREVIASGKIGRPGIVRTFRGGGGFPSTSGDWYANFEKSGGLILDMLIHDFDFLRWTLGEVQRVYGKCITRLGGERIQHAFITLRFESGAIALVEGLWADTGGFTSNYEIAGDNGLITFNGDSTHPLKFVSRREEDADFGVAVPKPMLARTPNEAELEHFLECIENDWEPLISGREAIEALRIALAAIRSVEENRPVSPKEVN